MAGTERGQVAQVVERSPEKAGVGGSTPSLATMFSITYMDFIKHYIDSTDAYLGLNKATVPTISSDFNTLHPHAPTERRLWRAAFGTPKNRIAAE